MGGGGGVKVEPPLTNFSGSANATYHKNQNSQLFVYKYRLLITFENSLYPDQARQNVGYNLDPNCFDTRMISLKEFFKKVDFDKKKISRRQNACENFQVDKELTFQTPRKKMQLKMSSAEVVCCK